MIDSSIKVPVSAELVAAVEEVCAAVEAMDISDALEGTQRYRDLLSEIIDSASRLRDVAKKG